MTETDEVRRVSLRIKFEVALEEGAGLTEYLQQALGYSLMRRDDEAAEGAFVENLHLGYFRGLTDADEIRDLILSRLRRLRAAGLGDPDEPVAAHRTADGSDEAAGSPALLEAARQVLRETQALAAAIR